MKLTEEQAEAIFFEEGYTNPSADEPEFGIVEEGDWEDNYKTQIRETIFEYEGKTYALCVTRSGSYYSEYYYDYLLECPQVSKIEVIKTEWRPVV